MKKKIIFIVLLGFLICGCSNVNNLKYDDIINTFTLNSGHINVYRAGYKYSLPRGMQSESNYLYNEILTDDQYKYYLYVDVISYYNKKSVTFDLNQTYIYTKQFSNGDKNGYVTIKKNSDNKYLIEIMYNYAKIEVMVDENDINKSMIYAINILKSITYNDSVIAKSFGKGSVTFSEEDYNIFNTTGEDSKYLRYDEDYTTEQYRQEIYDSDFIN